MPLSGGSALAVNGSIYDITAEQNQNRKRHCSSQRLISFEQQTVETQPCKTIGGG